MIAMISLAADDGPVTSPCVSRCKIHPDSGLCQGCLRTIDEIVAWRQADDEYKRAVWSAIAQRVRLPGTA